ncbi:hypothetical protein BZG36_02612 [Bifiguratus adelaidae]|uniref:Alginate lyase domain-containing protein n=1 Tax=Bifiguratus adelaidae TaxID=1938954 RepID=A0A261Y2P1_9FUNG|nr:hypothetical protein BZG36_02612 [Bifiguratus adelaidae]
MSDLGTDTPDPGDDGPRAYNGNDSGPVNGLNTNATAPASPVTPTPHSYPIPTAQTAGADVPDSGFNWVLNDPTILKTNKFHMHDYDQGLQGALWYLKSVSERYLVNQTVFTVNLKNETAASGDKHDYESLARYFWPNESAPNGLPYIRKDGHVNPEILSIPDYNLFRDMVKHVQYLALGYYFFNNETYAAKGVERINTWFVNEDTRMNPHLQYASYVKGQASGRGKGIIDFSVMNELLDAIVILQTSQSWQPRMNANLRLWFTQYRDWLENSPNGTYYDVQLMSVCIFLGDNATAQAIAQNATAARIAVQLFTTGEMHWETERPFSWFYSVFNMKDLFILGNLANRVGVDLFHYVTVDGKSIRKSLDFLLPYALNEPAWPYTNTLGFGASKELVKVLQDAFDVYGDGKYYNASLKVAHAWPMIYNVTRLTQSWDIFGDHSARTFGTASQAVLNVLPVMSMATMTIVAVFASYWLTLF